MAGYNKNLPSRLSEIHKLVVTSVVTDPEGLHGSNKI